MRNKDLLTILYIIFVVVFSLVLPFEYGLESYYLIAMLIISLLSIILMIPIMIIDWYGDVSDRWLDKAIINKKYFY